MIWPGCRRGLHAWLPLAGTRRKSGCVWRPRLSLRGRLLRLTRRARPLRRAPWIQTLPVRLARLLRSGPVLQIILPLLSRLTCPVGPVRIDQPGIGAPERALFGDDPAAESLRRVDLTHKTLVAKNLLR